MRWVVFLRFSVHIQNLHHVLMIYNPKDKESYAKKQTDIECAHGHNTFLSQKCVCVDSLVGEASFIQLISQLWIPHRTL